MDCTFFFLGELGGELWGRNKRSLGQFWRRMSCYLLADGAAIRYKIGGVFLSLSLPKKTRLPKSFVYLRNRVNVIGIVLSKDNRIVK